MICRFLCFLFWLSLTFGTSLHATPPNPFFAMDTIARGKPEVVVPLLKKLGYAGLGGQAGDSTMARELEKAGLHLFNGYLTVDLLDEQPLLSDSLKNKIDAMALADSKAVLWLAISKILKGGRPLARNSSDADEIAVSQLRQLAAYAKSKLVKISLYPHTGFWIDQVEDAIRVANQLNLENVRVTFNLCHWLKVEGSQRDPEPVLKAALPRLNFVTINGADAGDTKTFGWDRLIQPLGRGSYDVASFVGLLHRIQYNGPVGFQGYGISADPMLVLEETMQFWRALK